MICSDTRACKCEAPRCVRAGAWRAHLTPARLHAVVPGPRAGPLAGVLTLERPKGLDESTLLPAADRKAPAGRQGRREPHLLLAQGDDALRRAVLSPRPRPRRGPHPRPLSLPGSGSARGWGAYEDSVAHDQPTGAPLIAGEWSKKVRSPDDQVVGALHTGCASAGRGRTGFRVFPGVAGAGLCVSLPGGRAGPGPPPASGPWRLQLLAQPGLGLRLWHVIEGCLQRGPRR